MCSADAYDIAELTHDLGAHIYIDTQLENAVDRLKELGKAHASY